MQPLYGFRLGRIESLGCGRIIGQKQKTNALLQFVIYPKPMLHLPKAIQWGRENERKACQAYQKYIEKNGHTGLKITQAGLVVHVTKGWLGASPDGWVMDSLYNPSNGMFEIKCSYSMADKNSEEMCKDDIFFSCRWSFAP